MKKLLTAICIFVSCLVYGQKDTLWNSGGILRFISRGDLSLTVPTFDTVPIIMLYSDTADCFSLNGIGVPYSIEPIKYDTINHYKMEWTLWMPGWQVLERKNITYCFNCGPYWEHREYLDDSKKRLTENIVVWQVLKRKIQK